MGGWDFATKASGRDADDAFMRAREKALYDYGHRGYTGTIAEKTSFLTVDRKDGESADDCVRRCAADRDHFCHQKWEPAACVWLGPDPDKVGQQLYIFFGVASA